VTLSIRVEKTEGESSTVVELTDDDSKLWTTSALVDTLRASAQALAIATGELR
jgi:hypothetical protein